MTLVEPRQKAVEADLVAPKLPGDWLLLDRIRIHAAVLHLRSRVKVSKEENIGCLTLSAYAAALQSNSVELDHLWDESRYS